MNDTVGDGLAASGKKPVSASDGMIPETFKAEEERRINARHKALGITARTDRCGLALSGGGIRSATLSLGFLQGLAHLNGLRQFDYLSTVSGGGYTGSFYGSLHVPSCKRKNPEMNLGVDAARTYKAAAVSATELRNDSPACNGRDGKTPVQFLRDNGNYLAPNGGGDFMLATAVGIRNWVGVQYLIGVSLVTVLFFMSALRSVLPIPDAVEDFFRPHGSAIWWSVWWILPLLILLFALIPLGGAYWLTENDRTSDLNRGRLLRMLPVIALCVIAVSALCRALQWTRPSHLTFDPGVLKTDWIGTVCWVIAISASISGVIYFLCKVAVRHFTNEAGNGNGQTRRARVDRLRNLLTNGFVSAPRIGKDVVPLGLVPLFITTVAIAAIDTLGQSVLLWLPHALSTRLMSGAAVGAVLIAVVKFLATHVDEKTLGSVKKIPLPVLATVAALLLAGWTLVVWSVAAHAMLICFAPYSQVLIDSSVQSHVVEACEAFWQYDTSSLGLDQRLWTIGAMFAALMTLTIVCGWSLGFLNLSSLQRLYSTRLTRAYLGASNAARLASDGQRDVTELIEGDNIEMREYFAKEILAPVHLINVTLNTTVAWGSAGTQSESTNRAPVSSPKPSTVIGTSDSKLVHRNNRGMSMCVGPAGISVGAQYAHLECDWSGSDAVATPVTCYTEAGKPSGPGSVKSSILYLVESLSLGDWCAVSGAAVSTGLGANTRTGLSLILGVANIRLGYWWNASMTIWNWKRYRKGMRPALLPSIMPRGTVLSVIYRSLSTQLCLLSELIGRFYGPRRRRWYLTDGGHFENTAAYELVRRRLKMIVMLDNGADPEYEFGDLANLIRRVRLDFGVEIEEAQVPPQFDLGTLPFTIHNDVFTTVDIVRKERKWGDAFALCFAMTEKGNTFGHMIVIKPRVPDWAPVDIRQYAGKCDFPEQSTLQQFFDEAEWESYRKLGDLLAMRFMAPCSESVVAPDMKIA